MSPAKLFLGKERVVGASHNRTSEKCKSDEFFTKKSTDEDLNWHMGTWTRNFLVPKGDPTALRDIITRWMERKGFDPAVRSSLFADGSDDERGVFLVSNASSEGLLSPEAASAIKAVVQTFELIQG